MKAVVFETAGILDLRSITMFGVNAKPNSANPIGFFGTGLKYALAVLCRENIPVTIYCGEQKWTVGCRPTTFRNREFQEVTLTRHRKILPPQERVLPFTTELGKNWKLWQAFRELYANTLDEDGKAWVPHSDSEHEDFLPPTGRATLIVVTGTAFVEEYQNRETTFLPEGLRTRNSTDAVQVIKDRSSTAVFYRGLRVYDLKHPSKHTYNILQELELTEDRTVKNQWAADFTIATAISKSTDQELIENVVTSAEGVYEHELDFHNIYTAPSKEFLDVVEQVKSSHTSTLTNESALQQHGHYRPAPPKPPEAWNPYRLIEFIQKKEWNALIEMINRNQRETIELLNNGIERAADVEALKDHENENIEASLDGADERGMQEREDSFGMEQP